MKRAIGIGALLGIVLGVVLEFVFPRILYLEFAFNVQQYQRVHTASHFGHIYAVGILLPTVCGFLGGFLGYLFSFIMQYRKPKKQIT